ncbi:MAG: 3-oxoacyl-ACP reductase [Chloroflexi bacterium]|nr:3-oxoacyl-ACP reductase [Chloroflexota bacterium]
MRLEAVSLALPSRELTNEDILALVYEQSKATYTGDLDRVLRKIRFLLRYSGAERRHWLGHGEQPLALIRTAVDEALDRSGWGKADVDLLVYAGVDRACIEPANAYFIAQALDMPRVECFDVLDACNGWSRALHLIHALLQTGTYRRVLLVNAEFPMFAGGPVYPRLFTLRSEEELAWCFAGYTLGEGATATTLSRDPNSEWEFHFSSQPCLADLCTIPLEGYQRYCPPSERVGRNGVNHFASFSSDLYAAATREVAALFRRLSVPVEDIRAIFPHAASQKSWDDGAESLGVRDRLYHVYPRCGNLVSSSIPAGVASAIAAGRIRRGDRLAACVASAGMSYSVCSFIY